MFKFWRGSKEEQAEPRTEDNSSRPWYHHLRSLSYPNSPQSETAASSITTSSSNFSEQRPLETPQFPSPSASAGIRSALKNKSVDELRELLSDGNAYRQFLLSLDKVEIQSNIKEELYKETLKLARENLEKEPLIIELTNQCRIIRTTELAAAQEKLNDLEKKKNEILNQYSPTPLLGRLQEAMKKTDEESDNLHRQLLEKEIQVGEFLQKYKKLRVDYHRRALIHLARQNIGD